jgi:hypothetical protein
MHSEFEALRETLLREGVAPRHVRRYLVELRDHLADLTARERASGHDAKDAAIRARAALGDDQTLSRAMLERPGSRSLCARAPWAVFGLLPPLAAVAASLLVMGLPLAIARIHPLVTHGPAPAPDWFRALTDLIVNLVNYGLGLLIAIPFIVIALRQRMGLAWPLAGITLVAIFASLLTADAHFTTHLPIMTPHSYASYVLFSTRETFLSDGQHPLALTNFLFRMLLILLPATALYLALRQRLRALAPSA